MFELKSLSRIRLVMKERFRMRGTRKSRQGFFSRSLYRYRPPLCRTLDFANARFRLLRGFAILGITPSRFNVAINRHQFLLFFSNHSLAKMFRRKFSNLIPRDLRIIFFMILIEFKETRRVRFLSVIYFWSSSYFRIYAKIYSLTIKNTDKITGRDMILEDWNE